MAKGTVVMARSKTASLFIESCKAVLPKGAIAQIHTSESEWGKSTYIMLQVPLPRAANGDHRSLDRKIRISDHAIGMARYMDHDCDLYLNDTARPEAWAVWMSRFVREIFENGGNWPANPVLEPTLQPHSAG